MSKPTEIERMTLLTEQELARLVATDTALKAAWAQYHAAKEVVKKQRTPQSEGEERESAGSEVLRLAPDKISVLRTEYVYLSLQALPLQKQRLVTNGASRAEVDVCLSWAGHFERISFGRGPGQEGRVVKVVLEDPATWRMCAMAHGSEAQRVARLW